MVGVGLNKVLEKKLRKDFAGTPLILKIFGFTDKIYDYYQVTDLVITKPGGLTVTECLAFGLPMIMVNAIPGQEEENAKFVEKNEAGKLVKDQDDVPATVVALIQDREKLKALKDNASRIAPQDPCKKIFKEISE